MLDYKVKAGVMFTPLKDIDQDLIEPITNFLKKDLSPFLRDNKLRGNFFDGSMFIRFPNTIFVENQEMYDYLYKSNFNNISKLPQRFYDKKWNEFCAVVQPLIKKMQSLLPVEAEAIGAEINILPPGVNILTHKDHHQLLNETHRVHVVLETNDQSYMIGENLKKHWPVGSCFIFDNTMKHSVENNGNTFRSHLVVDFLPVEFIHLVKKT